MPSLTNMLAVVPMLAGLITALPATNVEHAAKMDHAAVVNDMAASSVGQVTYFAPGLGACGQYNGEGDAIVAVSAALFDSQRPCGRNIRIFYGGRSVQVRVVDRCAGCAPNDLDLSPSAFRNLVGGLDKGRVSAQWQWA